MNENILIEEQRKLDVIQKWLSETTEPFDDWDYDREELSILSEGKTIEKYKKEELENFIPDFL